MADNSNFTIDTDETQSIIRPDVVKEKCEVHCNVRLLTATGVSATVHGKTELKMRIGNVSVSHAFIVTDIVDEVIIGGDFMITLGIKLNMGNGL